MKDIKDMNQKEFNAAKSQALNTGFSPYGEFHFTHTGIQFYRNGEKIDKIDAFVNGWDSSRKGRVVIDSNGEPLEYIYD